MLGPNLARHGKSLRASQGVAAPRMGRPAIGARPYIILMASKIDARWTCDEFVVGDRIGFGTSGNRRSVPEEADDDVGSATRGN